MHRKLIVLPFALISFVCFSQKKSDSSHLRTKIEMEKFQPPPVANFDLGLFNIFVLKNGNIYYYCDSTFQKNESDEYDVKNLNESFLHKTTIPKLKEALQAYIRKGNQDVVLAVEGDDKKLRNMIFKE